MPFLTLESQRRLYYEDCGEGQPIVFLHGWKSCCDVYRPAIDDISKKYRCISYDHMGHKRSGVLCGSATMESLADDLHSLINALKLTRPVLVGWSMGGATVMEYVRKYGCSHISGIVLVDVSPRMLNDDEWKFGRLDGKYTAERRNCDIDQMKKDFSDFLYAYYCDVKVEFKAMGHTERSQMVQERLVGYDIRTMTQLWESLSIADYRASLPQIKIPVAIFHADTMAMCNQGAVDYYKASIPSQVFTKQYINASHALISEYPQIFAEDIITFANACAATN